VKQQRNRQQLLDLLPGRVALRHGSELSDIAKTAMLDSKPPLELRKSIALKNARALLWVVFAKILLDHIRESIRIFGVIQLGKWLLLIITFDGGMRSYAV
jgi:hypothetical protein